MATTLTTTPNPNPNSNPNPILNRIPKLSQSLTLTLNSPHLYTGILSYNQVTGMATGTGLADAGVSYASVEEAAQVLCVYIDAIVIDI